MPKFRLILVLAVSAVALLSLAGVGDLGGAYGILSVLPPLFAIFLALATREVIPALLGGVWLGASYLAGGNPAVGLFRTLDEYLVSALADRDHAFILLFSLTLGGMVGIISAGGGAAGIVQKVSRWAKTPRSGQIAAWLMGIFIFFDDYANTLIVGNTFRPLTDRLRISREKLSFIVDATAAPIASIALISTWIGFEVGLIGDGLINTPVIEHPAQAYGIFIQTIPYRFYPLFMLLLVFLVGWWNRDFGPMREAEQRCRRTGKVLADGARPLMKIEETSALRTDLSPHAWLLGMIPVAVVIVVTCLGLYYSGKAALGEAASGFKLYQVISQADSFAVLMWASFAGVVCAGLLAGAMRTLNLPAVLEAFTEGVKSMTTAAIVLLLAWAIGGICVNLGTADYVLEISRGILSPHLIPALTFLISGAVSFATGTSWGTLSILMPVVAPLSYNLPLQAGISPDMSASILIGSIGAVLAGSVFGDHASPISDTTIMSSMASGSDHIDHVRTQLPYALLAAGLALFIGYLPAGWGVSPLFTLPLGGIALVVLLRVISKPVE